MNDLHDQFNREAALQLLHPPIYEEVNPRDESHDLDNCCRAKNYFTLRHKKRVLLSYFFAFSICMETAEPIHRHDDLQVENCLQQLCHNFAATALFAFSSWAPTWTYRTPPISKEGKGTSFFTR